MDPFAAQAAQQGNIDPAGGLPIDTQNTPDQTTLNLGP